MSIPGVGDWFNPDEGTFVVEGEAQPRGLGIDWNRAPLLKIGNTPTEQNGLVIDRVDQDGDYYLRTRQIGAAVSGFIVGNATGVARVAATYSAGGDVRGSLNGGNVVSGANLWDGAADFLYIGTGGIDANNVGNRRANGPISRITYYPRALTNEQLQALTS